MKLKLLIIFIVTVLFFFAFGYYREKFSQRNNLDRSITKTITKIENVSESFYDEEGFAKLSTENFDENTGDKLEDFLNSSLNRMIEISNDNFKRIEESGINQILDPIWMKDKSNHKNIPLILDEMRESARITYEETFEYRSEVLIDFKKLTSDSRSIEIVEEKILKTRPLDKRIYELNLEVIKGYSEYSYFLIEKIDSWVPYENTFTFYSDEDLNKFNVLVEKIIKIEDEALQFVKTMNEENIQSVKELMWP